MENYKPNSFKYREQQKQASVEERNTQKIVNGPVTTKKKTGLQKIKHNLLTDDIPKVKNYILVDVLVPSIKKAISDIVRNGIDMLLYGEAGRTKNSDRIPGSKVSYRNYYNQSDSSRINRTPTAKSAFDYDDIVLSSRGDAELVIDQLIDIIEKYSFARVADLYDLVGISTTNHCVNNYGWTDLRTAHVNREYDGYVLKLPRPIALD